MRFPEELRRYTFQVDHGLHLICLDPRVDPTCYFNHSCEPNCGVVGTTLIVAMVDIAAGDELTWDYAMSESAEYQGSECACGTTACRGTVAASDWRLPELQEHYRGFMFAYLVRASENG